MRSVLSFVWIYPLSVALAITVVGLGVAVLAKLMGYPVRSLIDPFWRPDGTSTYPDGDR